MLFYKTIFIVLTVFGVETLKSDHEATVETVGADYYHSNLKNDVKTNVINTHGFKRKPKNRQSRLLLSYRQNPIIDMMMMMPAFNYAPKNPSDLFDFLRDSYPLPGGKYK